MIDRFGPIDEQEVINAAHPDHWKRADVLMALIKGGRPNPSITYSGRIPGEQQIRHAIIVFSCGALQSLPHLVLPAEAYGLDNELAENSLYLCYSNQVDHYSLLLKGLVMRKILDCKATTMLQDESWVTPKPVITQSLIDAETDNEKYFKDRMGASDVSDKDRFQFSEFRKYGVGSCYYKLTAEGARMKTPVKKGVFKQVGERQSV